MPAVQGILETALYIHDVERAAEFYRRIFGFSTLHEVDRLIALSVADRNVLLLFKEGATHDSAATPGEVMPGRAGAAPAHFAFPTGVLTMR